MRYVILLAMIVVGLLLCLDVAYMSRGSLEMFPTEEQEDKVRRVTVFIAVVLVTVEVGLWWHFRDLKRESRRTGNSVPG